MTTVDLDHQPDSVKQFFRTLPPEGSLVELGGRPVARVLPADISNADWTDAKNARRHALIDRAIAGTITRDESLELELLQDELQRYVERVAPLPLDHARDLHRQLLTKAAGNGSAPP